MAAPRLPALYLETTILSYLAARPSPIPEIASVQRVTRQWWETRRHDFRLVISELVLAEAERGDREAATARIALATAIPSCAVTDDAARLARSLLAEGAVPAKAAADALHIAIAAVHGCRYLLTWNCRHIANAERMVSVRLVIERNGYPAPVLCTPDQLLWRGDDADQA